MLRVKEENKQCGIIIKMTPYFTFNLERCIIDCNNEYIANVAKSYLGITTLMYN